MNNKWMRLVILAILITGIGLVITYRAQLDAAALEQWVQNAGLAAPLIFMLIYAVGAVFFLPGSVLTLAGGALFGPVLGTFYNLTGATLGATLAFMVARYLAEKWVTKKTGGRLKQLIEGVEHEGWRFVAFVRLVPLFPFNLLNYALGLTRIRLSHYIIASYVCMLPGAIAYTYLGYAGREALAGTEGLMHKGLLALGLLAVVVFIPRFVQRLREPPAPKLPIGELKRRLERGEPLLILDVRSPAEFKGELGHIKGSINIPVEELHPRLNELEAHRDRPIAIVCRTDRRSAKAAQLLHRAGFSSIFVATNGMIAWTQAGLPIER